jgi:LPXTG-motif cell wall-anchored protein
MSPRLHATLGVGLALLLCGATAQAAAGDGLPVPFDGGDNAGVASLDGDFRYATVAAGRSTAAVRIATGTGEIQRSTELRGDYGVPLVAYDGTPSGLSADGERLVLIKPRVRFPRERTSLALLDAERLRLREEITLRGDFSFDAISPSGGTIYLIEYTDPRDPTAYEVRAYDVERGKLLPDPIIDPNETGEEMAGFPQTRAMSPDGRWAYTLYETPGKDHPPFIHALDTARGTAVCIDLDALADHRQVWRLGLQPSPDGAVLGVVDRGQAIANVDLATFEVSEPAIPPAPPAEAGPDEDGTPWLLIAGGGVLLIVAGALIVLRRRPDEVDERELDRLVDLERAAREAAEGEEEGATEREPVR